MDGARDPSRRRVGLGENVFGEIFRVGRTIRLRRDRDDRFELVDWPTALSIGADASRRSESRRKHRYRCYSDVLLRFRGGSERRRRRVRDGERKKRKNARKDIEVTEEEESARVFNETLLLLLLLLYIYK